LRLAVSGMCVAVPQSGLKRYHLNSYA